MNNGLTLGLILAFILLAFSRKKGSVKTERYRFVAKNDLSPAFACPQKNGEWIPDFSKVAYHLKAGQFISDVWLGDITDISPTGVKTPFYVVEITVPSVPAAGFLGFTIPVAVRVSDVNRYVLQ